jgi:hypothetical protein
MQVLPVLYLGRRSSERNFTNCEQGGFGGMKIWLAVTYRAVEYEPINKQI